MTTAKWTAQSQISNIIPAANMNSLANGSWATGASTTFIDNTTNLNLYMDIQLILASAVSAGASAPAVDIYLLPSLDGTNLPTPPGTSAALIPTHYLIGSILANPSANFTRGVFRGVVLPPTHFVIAIQNNLGVAFPASGNAIHGFTYNEQGV